MTASAPSVFASSARYGWLSTAITRAPRKRALITPPSPTGPMPVMSTVSNAPAFISFIALKVGPSPQQAMPACSYDIPSGIGSSSQSCFTTYCAYVAVAASGPNSSGMFTLFVQWMYSPLRQRAHLPQGYCGITTTRSPTFTLPGCATSTTSPAASWPNPQPSPSL